MKGKYIYKSYTVVYYCLVIAILLIAIGGLCKLNIFTIFALIVAFSSHILQDIPSFFETDNEKVCFKIGHTKKEIYYSDIDLIICEVIKDGFFRLTYEQLYAMELRIVKKDGRIFKTKCPFDVTTAYILNNRAEYEERVYNHKLSKLQRYIDTQII